MPPKSKKTKAKSKKKSRTKEIVVDDIPEDDEEVEDVNESLANNQGVQGDQGDQGDQDDVVAPAKPKGRATYKKTLNAYQTRDGSTFVYFKKNKVPVGSQEYNKLSKIYQVEEGRFTHDTPKIQGRGYDIKKIIKSYDASEMPEIGINTRQAHKIPNPFTGGSFNTKTKAGQKKMKEFLMIYRRVGNKLVPREQPTHVIYRDKAGNQRVTARDSKLVQDRTKAAKGDDPAGGYNIVDNTLVKYKRVERRTVMNNQVIHKTIQMPEANLAVHSRNTEEIMSIYQEHLIPELEALGVGATVILSGNMRVNPRGRAMFYTTANLGNHQWVVNANGTNNLGDFLMSLIRAIGNFDGRTFNTEDYLGYLAQLQIAIFPSDDAGGCHYGDRLREPDPEDRSVTLVSYQVAKDSENCLLAILKRVSGRFKGSRMPFNKIRGELGLDLGVPIHYHEIEKRGMAKYFDVTIYLDRQGSMIQFGSGRESGEVYIKLRGGHYYHVLKKKRVNGALSQKAYAKNSVFIEEGGDSSEGLLQRKLSVLQPTSKMIRKEPIDFDYVIHVDSSIGKDLTPSSQISWRFREEDYTGTVRDMFMIAWKLSQNLKKDDAFYYGLGWKPMKKVVVHCFGGRELLFPVIEQIVHSQEWGKEGGEEVRIPKLRERHFCAYDFARIVFYDLSSLFSATFHELLEDVRDGLRGVDSEVDRGLSLDIGLESRVCEYIFQDVYMFFNVHLYEFVSLPGLGEGVWKSMIRYEEGQEICFLEGSMFKFVLRANYGARNMPLKTSFESSRYDELVKSVDSETGKVNPSLVSQIQEKKDYLSVIDSFGCYPAAMTKYPYPAGPSRWMTESELSTLNDRLAREVVTGVGVNSGLLSSGSVWKIGYLEVEYIPPSDLRMPVLVRHDPLSEKLVYDLLPGQGVYASVELDRALSLGYRIHRVVRGVVWEKTCGTYFTDYMKKVIQLKISASGLRRRMGKLLMNSLYGKMLSKTKYARSKTCRSLKELQNYAERHWITDFKVVSERMIVAGVSKEVPQKLEVPVHLGCLVLAYSRCLMMDFFETVCPRLRDELVTYYTDNDSLFIQGSLVSLLEDRSLLIPDDVDKSDVGLMFSMIGRGKNDIKDGLMIVKARFLVPKMYYYTYIGYDGRLKSKIAGCGISGKWLNRPGNRELVISEFFEKMERIVVEDAGGEKPRTPSLWDGMDLCDDGSWYPKGYAELR